MYASDITRTLPVNGHFTARQREIYNIVLGAQRAAIDAFVAGKSKINDRDRRDPDSLDSAAYNYIDTHGKDLHGSRWAVLAARPRAPGGYRRSRSRGISGFAHAGVGLYHRAGSLYSEEKLGVRIECVFLVGADGKLIDLVAALPHSAEMWKPRCKGSRERWTRTTKWKPIGWRCWRWPFESNCWPAWKSAREAQGLFSGFDRLSGEVDGGEWPEAERLRELALALQGVFAQQGRQISLCDEFLDLCSIHGRATQESDGWPKRFWSGSRGAK